MANKVLKLGIMRPEHNLVVLVYGVGQTVIVERDRFIEDVGELGGDSFVFLL